MPQQFEILQVEGAFFKITINKDGEEQRREVVRCECGDYISKKTMRNHLKSKKHQQWLLKQFAPLERLSQYRDVLKTMKKLEEEKKILESQLKWGQEEDDILDRLPMDDERRQAYMSLKPAVEGQMELETLDELLNQVMSGLKLKKTTTPKKKKKKPVKAEEEVAAQPEPEAQESTTAANEEKAQPEEEVPVEKPPEQTVVRYYPNGKQIFPEELGIGIHPDTENLPGCFLIFKPTNFALPKLDMEEFFRHYGFEIQPGTMIDVSDVTLKQRFMRTGAYWDIYRENEHIEKNWLPEDEAYFEKSWEVRGLTLVRAQAFLSSPLLEGETFEWRMENLKPGDRVYPPTKGYSNLFYWKPETNELFSLNDIIFPITMSKKDHRHPFGRCQHCSTFIEDVSYLPCRHSICESCYQKKKRSGNCILTCMVCQLRFKDYWEVLLDSDEEPDEEGNVWKNGKMVRPYWKRIKR